MFAGIGAVVTGKFGLTLMLLVAAAILPQGFFFGRKRRKEREASPQAPAHDSRANPAQDTASGPLAGLVARLDFDDLADFGLLTDLGAIEAGLDANATDGARDDAAASAILSEAIRRLDDPDVPREIQGQRLAAVITKCSEATDWSDLPATAAVARECLAQRTRQSPGG